MANKPLDLTKPLQTRGGATARFIGRMNHPSHPLIKMNKAYYATQGAVEKNSDPALSAPSAEEVIEMCAKVCDSRATSHATDPRSPGWATKHTEAEDCATAIRSLKSKEGGAG